jgi:regulator of replication initiation timing
MTPEERRASEQEAKRLLAEIHRLHAQIERKIIENENLKVELETLIKNIEILTENTKTMDAEVNKSMLYVKERFDDADISTHQLFELIDDLTKSYFIFKNMSTASKNVTQFTDEYYTKFKFFNKLR